MTDDEIKRYIDMAIRRTVSECKRSGLLLEEKSVAYKDAAELISAYYRDGKADIEITYAIQGLRFDPYYRIIDMYFGDGLTNEDIADAMGCAVSTIMRNKRRLCLKIYDEVV